MKEKVLRNNNGKENKNILKKVLLFAGLGLLLPVLLLYGYFSFYYENHFYKNTYINGVNVSHMTVSQAEDTINAQAKYYILTLEERNSILEQIKGEDIGLHTDFGGNVERLLTEQNGLSWPASMLDISDYSIDTMLKYDETLLKQRFDELNCFIEANVLEPVNAYISDYTEDGYIIVPEEPGTKIIKDILFEAVTEAVLSLEPTLSLEEIDCYVKPEITSDHPELIRALNELNKIAGTKITYEFGDITEIVDGSLISQWLSMNENYEVSFDKDKVKEYVDYIGKTYNTFGKVRTFKTSYGKELQIKGGDYGWWLNRPAETAELTELILNGEQLIKQPVYYQTAQSYGPDDIGNTYVEINLTAQHLFFYKDGKLIVETDFVSGDIKKKNGTPSGTYPIQYKQRNAVLNGEDYSTPVKYWMPFNGDIGMHDASWRSKFGKDIYLTNGSHGCINMPEEAAKITFDNIQRGVAVVVYELEGTETYEKKKEEPKKEEQKKKEQKKEDAKTDSNTETKKDDAKTE